MCVCARVWCVPVCLHACMCACMLMQVYYVHMDMHTYMQIYICMHAHMACLLVHVIMCTCVYLHECYSTKCVHSPCNCSETSNGCVSEVLVTGSLLMEDFFGSVVSEP